MSLIKQDDLVFNILNGNVYCSSQEIAKEFGKGHDKVLDKIDLEVKRFHSRNLGSEISRYFIDSSYINSRGRTYRRYDLTYIGFQMVALTFTGDKAFDNRLRFINAFEKLLNYVSENKAKAIEFTKDLAHIELREDGKLARNRLTDAVRDYMLPQRVKEGKETSQFVKRYVTSFTTHIVYKKFGISSPKGVSVNRDAFTAKEKVRVMDLEDRIADMIAEYAKQGIHYKDIYKKIKSEV